MRRSFPLLLLLFCGTAFSFGLFELFKLRYEIGDVYPEYSSLRTDPLGAMIFYESLEQFPHLSLRRDFNADNRLPEGRNSVYLHLAASRLDWVSLPAELWPEIESFLLNGGRLVVTFLPENSPPFRVIGVPARPAPTKPQPNRTRKIVPADSLKERWGVEFGFAPLPPGNDSTFRPVQVVNRSDLALPGTLPWHSGVIFTNLANSWRTIYARGTNAVLIERKFGSGSVLMATDSYFISNEAMARERHADLLSWLIGSPQLVVFDEAHLGITEAPGISSLMRRYRLQGLAVGLLVLAGLFIWKNSTSLVPPYVDEMATQQIIGKDASAGLVNLLRRNIAPQDVLRVCFEEWTKSLQQGGSHSISRVDHAQAVLEAENARAKVDRDPVRAYQEICRVLKGRARANLKP